MRFTENADSGKIGLFVITNLIVSICKRGTISAHFFEKIKTAIHQDLGTDVSITLILVNSIWGAYGQYIDDTNVKALLDYLLDNIMADAVRFHVTISQARFQGFTVFQTIGRAMLKHPELRIMAPSRKIYTT